MGSFGNMNSNQAAVIYCRVSSSKQVREGHGLDGQESRCRNYAKSNGREIVKVFREEGVSGGLSERPAFFDMLNFIKEQKRRQFIVIIDDLSRLARDVGVHRSYRAAIAKMDATLECVAMVLEDSPEGNFVETIVAATSELERNQNKRRVRVRMHARLESGYWVFNNPVGYN